MHVSGRPRRLDLISRQLNRALQAFQRELEIPDSEWRDILGISSAQHRQIVEGRRFLPTSSLYRLAGRFSLSIEAIIAEEIDFTALLAHEDGDLAYLPEPYLLAAHSRRRTVKNLLDFSERHFGPPFRKQILRKLQVHEAAFADGDAPINVRFIMKLFDYLKTHGFQGAHFHAMGHYTLISCKNTTLSAALSSCESPAAIYLKLLQGLTPFFEKNCDYRLLKLEEHVLWIESKENREVADALKLKRIGSPEVCRFKAGILASLPGYAGFRFSEVKEIACVHMGSPNCIFEINFTKANQRSNPMPRYH